jgi:hypothetical protein
MSGLNKRSTDPVGDQKKMTFVEKFKSVGERLQKKRDARETTWDKVVKRGKK